MSGFPPCVPCGGRETNHDRSVHRKGASHLSAGKSSRGGMSQGIEPPPEFKEGQGHWASPSRGSQGAAERASAPRLGTGITKEG